MADKKTPDESPADEPAGAWAKDELYGTRIDNAFPLAEGGQASTPFLVLGAKVDGQIETVYGPADHASFAVQRLDEKGRPTGIPFKVGTLASAIVEKIRSASDADFPAIVQLMKAPGRFGKDALVIQKLGDTDPSSLLDEFAISGDTLKSVDQLRPESERIPY